MTSHTSLISLEDFVVGLIEKEEETLDKDKKPKYRWIYARSLVKQAWIQMGSPHPSCNCVTSGKHTRLQMYCSHNKNKIPPLNVKLTSMTSIGLLIRLEKKTLINTPYDFKDSGFYCHQLLSVKFWFLSPLTSKSISFRKYFST